MSGKLYIIAMPIFSTMSGYLLSKVDPVDGFFSAYLQSKWQLPVLLSLFLLLCVLVPYRFLSINPKTNTTDKVKSTNFVPLEISRHHLSVLKVFRKNDGELTSVPIIQQYTDLEIIVINSILDDLEMHKLIHATNFDEFEGGWQYQLSGKGRKLILKLT